VPAGKASSALLPGGPGIMPAGTMTGVRGASLEVGLAVGGVTPAPWTVGPRSLARIAPGDNTPLGKSRGGTPEGELSPPVQGTAPHRKRCGGYNPTSFRRSISFLFWRNGKSEERQRGQPPLGVLSAPASRFT